jgi:multisubunit Na+/H+ antiporter MnhC subunit
MRDIVIGVAFLAMLLSPALVASFSKGKSDDES